MSYVSLKVSRETYAKLMEVKGLLEARHKKPLSIDETLRHLLEGLVRVEEGKIRYRLDELMDGVFFRVEYKGDTLLIGRSGDKLVICSLPSR